jgi:hypothetical protein
MIYGRSTRTICPSSTFSMALGKGGNFGRLVVISALGKTADKAGAVEIAGIFRAQARMNACNGAEGLMKTRNDDVHQGQMGWLMTDDSLNARQNLLARTLRKCRKQDRAEVCGKTSTSHA